MEKFKEEIKACQICVNDLPFGANPVFQIASGARVVIIGQAPGKKVHESGIPWDDASGNRLREWLNVSNQTFYDPVKANPAICHPGPNVLHNGITGFLRGWITSV